MSLLVKILLRVAAILLFAFCIIYLYRSLTSDDIGSEDNNPIITVDTVSNGGAVQINNPSQSTDFSDIGNGVYTNDVPQFGPDSGFTMTYFSEDDSFAIDISGKPFSQYRDSASQYLLQTLNIGPEQACNLKVYVGVSYDTEPSLSGKNLGLSFCPGAVKL